MPLCRIPDRSDEPVPTYSVTRVIDFCYGHRLLRYAGECRHLHGHNGRLEIDIVASSTDERGMVVDFADIRDRVKTWIDANLDHRMILHREDPLVPVLQEQGELHYTIDVNPTAENIAAHIYAQVASDDWPVAEVRLWETPNSYAAYRPSAGD